MDFINQSKALVCRYANENDINHDDTIVHHKQVFVVWQSKTLQNYKAILGVPGHNNMIFEVTYNGDKEEYYLDAYAKQFNGRYDKEGADKP